MILSCGSVTGKNACQIRPRKRFPRITVSANSRRHPAVLQRSNRAAAKPQAGRQGNSPARRAGSAVGWTWIGDVAKYSKLADFPPTLSRPCCARGVFRPPGGSVAPRVREECSRAVDGPQSRAPVGAERGQERELPRLGSPFGGTIQAHPVARDGQPDQWNGSSMARSRQFATTCCIWPGPLDS